jgi:hypothetical protein
MQKPTVSIVDETLTSLRKLHPEANHSLPAPPPNTALDLIAVEWSKLAPLIKRRVNNGSAPGPSGWTGSHLQLLADCEDREVVDGLCQLTKDICNGVFTGATQQRLLACLLQPISKDGSNTNVRPIAMGEVFVKLAAHYGMLLIEEQLPALFPRIQFGVKHAGGSESAAHLTRALLLQSAALDATTIALKTDFENAFNRADRSQMWVRLLQDKRTEPIWRMFHWAYSVASPLLVYDQRDLRAVLMSSEGVRQGDPFAAFVFAFLVQPLYEAAIAELPECHAVSIQDDLTLVGPQEQVFKAFDRIQQMAASFHLTLRVDKCAVYIPASVSTAEDRERIIRACADRSLAHSDRMESLGVMHGSDDAIRTQCAETVERHRSFFTALTHPAMPVQIGLTLLRYCALPRLSYLARTTHPANLSTAASDFDRMAWECFAKLVGLSGSPAAEIQEQIQLPLSMGGLGMRPVTSYSATAYFASLAATLPDYIAAFTPVTPSAPGASTAASTSAPVFVPCASPDAPRAALQFCWNAMQAQGVTGSTAAERNSHGAAPPSSAAPADSSVFSVHTSEVLPRLWRRAHAHARKLHQHRCSPITHPHHPGDFLRAEKLQAEATRQREETQLAQLHARSPPFRQALLTAAAVPHTTAFLTALPTIPAYTLDNEAMRLAIRHRLGLPASDELQSQQCVCGASFASDPDHFHSCVQTRSNSLTKRHDAIVHTLAELAHEAGWLVTVEPNEHLRPADHAHAAAAMVQPLALAATPAAAPTAATAPEAISPDPDDLPAHYNRHGDLLLLRHASKLYIDVSVARPTNASTLRYHPAVTSQPLLSTRTRAATKRRHYAAIAAVNQYELLPFVMETYGGLGMEANKVIRYLAASVQHMQQREFTRHAHTCLSMALQRGNAAVALLGQQTLHWKRQLRQRGQRFREAAERARHYARQTNATTLAERMQPEISAIKAAGAASHTQEAEAEAEAEIEVAAASASSPLLASLSSRSGSSSLSFIHSRLSCVADVGAHFSDCEIEPDAESPREATADQRDLCRQLRTAATSA